MLDLTPDEVEEMSREVRELARERDAVILAHNYQRARGPGSCRLHRRLARALAQGGGIRAPRSIAFCGVHFMAETASILSPEKTVLIPDLDAGCSLADSIDADELRAWKARHSPDAVVVMYVNTSAEVKAETDYCCTSSNAVKVVEHICAEHGPDTEILFGPDMWLGAFVERETGLRRLDSTSGHGECHVHAGIRPDDIERPAPRTPTPSSSSTPSAAASTQVMEYVAAGEVEEEGVHMLSTRGCSTTSSSAPTASTSSPPRTACCIRFSRPRRGASLIEANRMAYCKYMKMITLPKLRDTLREMKFEVSVPAEIAERARIPIERMVAIG